MAEYTAEQYEEQAHLCESCDYDVSVIISMLRQAAQMMRERAMSDPVTDDRQYFAADPANGDFDIYNTLAEARHAAQDTLNYAREDACEDGWADDPPQICYGVVLAQCVETTREVSTENPGFSDRVDFELRERGDLLDAARSKT